MIWFCLRSDGSEVRFVLEMNLSATLGDGAKIKSVIFEQIVCFKFTGSSGEIALSRMPKTSLMLNQHRFKWWLGAVSRPEWLKRLFRMCDAEPSPNFWLLQNFTYYSTRQNEITRKFINFYNHSNQQPFIILVQFVWCLRYGLWQCILLLCSKNRLT